MYPMQIFERANELLSGMNIPTDITITFFPTADATVGAVWTAQHKGEAYTQTLHLFDEWHSPADVSTEAIKDVVDVCLERIGDLRFEVDELDALSPSERAVELKARRDAADEMTRAMSQERQH